MWDLIPPDLREISRKLDLVLALLKRMSNQENTMAIDLTKLTAEVAANTSVTTSVEALVTSLAAQIAAIPPSNDPATQAALDALVQTLNANDTGLAAAVTANTPVTPAAAAATKS
jgi:hypothetical protein